MDTLGVSGSPGSGFATTGRLIIIKQMRDATGYAVSTLLTGKQRIWRGECGAFYNPTLLEVADSSLSIVQEEVFGPVLTLQVFESEDEAVQLANDSEYGLSACFWTRDADRPIRISRKLNAGLISIK